jgi:chloride channel protein, CIC family
MEFAFARLRIFPWLMTPESKGALRHNVLATIRSLPKPQRPTSLAENLNEHFRIARHVFLVAAPIGVIVGAAVAAYDYVVNALLWGHFTHWLSPLQLAFLPIAGMILTGLILTLFRVPSSSMADEVVLAYHRPEAGIALRTAIPKLAASVTTMGFGASAGMEGASKWLGGTISLFIQRQLNRSSRLKPFHGRAETTMLAGAAAGIGAIFRAPLTGAIMGIESPYKNDLAHESLIHALVAASTSYATFVMFRPSAPYFPIRFVYHLNLRDLLICVPLGLAGGLASHLFLGCLSRIKRTWGRSNAPRVLKLLSGGVIVSAIAVAMYYLVGEPATLQAGLPVANRLLNGKYLLIGCLLIFAAKLLATAFTFGTGGVGGLFVPSATIGAALGASFDAIFHPSQPGLFTLIGIAAFTGASYNSLLFAAVFVAEATGSPALVVPSLIASSTAFLLASGISNSESQRPRRSSDDSLLASMPSRNWMTTRIVVAKPEQTLSRFMERHLVEHSFQELPVVSDDGIFLGLVSVKSLRSVPRNEWNQTPVSSVMDPRAKTLCGAHSMALAEKELALGHHDYLPVVEPSTDQLIGILSSSDVMRARQHAQDGLETCKAKVTVMHHSENLQTK